VSYDMSLGIFVCGKAPPIRGPEPGGAQGKKAKSQKIKELLHGPATSSLSPNR